MKYVLVENGKIIKTSLPKVGKLINGETISGYDKLSVEKLLIEGWLPLEDIKPSYYNQTHYLKNNGYDIGIDKVVALYDVMEIVQPNLEEIKANKIANLSILCKNAITSGVDSDCFDGESKHYSFEQADQLNILGSVIKGTMGLEITYKADNEVGECYVWTMEQMTALSLVMNTHITSCRDKYGVLKKAIQDCSTIEEVNSIAWK